MRGTAQDRRIVREREKKKKIRKELGRLNRTEKKSRR